MGFIEGFSPQGLIESLEDVTHKQSMFYRNLRQNAEAEFGTAALRAIESGLGDYGRWRAGVNKTQPSVLVAGGNAAAKLSNWECADFQLFACDVSYFVEQQAGGLDISLTGPPELEYFDAFGQGEWLWQFWEWMLRGVSEEFGDLAVESTRSDGQWRLRIRGSGLEQVPALVSSPHEVLGDAARAIALIRQSSVHNGALYFFLARAIMDQFDASGEACVRAAVRAIGRERGSVLRERHLSQGKELNLENLMNDWDGPLASVWQWRDEGVLNRGQWLQDCSWCPYASAWNQFGEEGRAIGYLYDIELHTSMYTTYLPGIRVRWETLMTRGDSTCGFRIEVNSDDLLAANAPPHAVA